MIANCKAYFFSRIRRLYPEYIFSVLLCALLMNVFSHHLSMRAFMLNVVMMGGWGGIPNIIDGVWYVVVLFWGGCLLFNLLSISKEKAFLLILPMISLVCLFYLINHGCCIFGHQQGIAFGLISEGTFRGMLGLTIGIYLFSICKNLKEAKINIKPKMLAFFLFCLEVVSVALLINAILIRKNQDVSDFNIYFYVSCIIGLLFFKKEKLLKFLSWHFWQPLAKLSYMIYLTHLILIYILKKHLVIELNTISPLAMFSTIVILSIVFGWICCYLQKWLFKKLKEILLIC